MKIVYPYDIIYTVKNTVTKSRVYDENELRSKVEKILKTYPDVKFSNPSLNK